MKNEENRSREWLVLGSWFLVLGSWFFESIGSQALRNCKKSTSRFQLEVPSPFGVRVFGFAPRSVAARIAGWLAALGLPPDPNPTLRFLPTSPAPHRGAGEVGKGQRNKPFPGGSSQSLATDRLSERQPFRMLNPTAFP